MSEEWKQITEGVEVSSLGRVRKTWIPKLTSGHYTKLLIKKASKRTYTHQIIYEAFNEKVLNGCVIDHVDGNKCNNAISNLEMVSRAENTKRWRARSVRRTSSLNGKCRKGHDKQGRTHCLICRRELRKNPDRQPPNLNWKKWNGYLVSDCGKIWSPHVYRILDTTVTGTGYATRNINPAYKGKKYWTVHRIVWDAFVGDVPEGFVIDHIDENKLNNRLSNLECVSYAENSKRKWKSRKRKLKGCNICKKTYVANSKNSKGCPDCGSRKFYYK